MGLPNDYVFYKVSKYKGLEYKVYKLFEKIKQGMRVSIEWR